MFSLRQYLFSLSDPEGLTRHLGRFTLRRDAAGNPYYTVGNSAAVFRICHEGREKALRCYFRPMSHLRLRYGEALFERELYLYDSPISGRWVDVVVTDWIEGETLDRAIRQAAERHDHTTLSHLSAQFDRLAARLLTDDWAHGDLKPDNIILTPEGELQLIDWDATYLPVLHGADATELGTSAYQHPARRRSDFDARLDDYPAALISSALYALSLDPTLYDRYGREEGLLLDPHRLPQGAAYQELLRLFEERGEALRYRILQSLTYPIPQLPHLIPLFMWLTRPAEEASQEMPELYVEQGLWGFRTAEQVVIPPLYNSGFDFTEGLAAVQLGSRWHFIDRSGRVMLHVPPCEAVKPFRNGFAVVSRGNKRLKMDKAGFLFDF